MSEAQFPRILNIGSPVSENFSSETVRKVSDAPETKPYGPPKRGFLAHFGLRVPAKSTPGASLAPFSDSFSRHFGKIKLWQSTKPLRMAPGDHCVKAMKEAPRACTAAACDRRRHSTGAL